jgi:hypothetical protein
LTLTSLISLNNPLLIDLNISLILYFEILVYLNLALGALTLSAFTLDVLALGVLTLGALALGAFALNVLALSTLYLMSNKI